MNFIELESSSNCEYDQNSKSNFRFAEQAFSEVRFLESNGFKSTFTENENNEWHEETQYSEWFESIINVKLISADKSLLPVWLFMVILMVFIPLKVSHHVSFFHNPLGSMFSSEIMEERWSNSK